MKRYISITEAAKYSGIGVNKMYELVRSSPDLPTAKIGSFTKINVKLLDEWLDKIAMEGRRL